MDGLNKGTQVTEKRFSELEDRMMEITQSEQQRENGNKYTELQVPVGL